MTQAEKKIVEALYARLAEIDAERSWIRTKLTEYEAGENALFSASAFRVGALRGKQFEVNPNSRTSRMLEAARGIIESSPARVMTFLDLFDKLPTELIPPTKNGREIVRKILREEGHRVGLNYVSANMITLESPHLVSTG